MKKLLPYILLPIMLVAACKEDPKPAPAPKVKKPRAHIPSSHVDSVYSFVEQQLAFGHRIPGTPEHVACKDWLVGKFESYGASVQEQTFKASFFDKKDQPAYNIIATYNPEKEQRVLLAAHWDSRLVAEKDPEESMKNSPIHGADDGGSGVAALLEIARHIHLNPIDLGVDIILFDAEDNGGEKDTFSWCLGSQHWSKNKHVSGYNPEFGILLDMVGAKGATFPKEGHSQTYAKRVHDKVWTLAQNMSYGDLFINQPFPGINDDHWHVNRIAKIPMIDIINWDLSRNTFDAYHHTHDDNIDVIDKNVLRTVTQVVLATIYKVSDGSF